MKLYLVEKKLYYYCHNVDTPGMNQLNTRFFFFLCFADRASWYKLKQRPT